MQSRNVQILLDADKIEEALSLSEQLLSKTPEDASLLYLRGCAFMKKSEWGNAMTCFLQSKNLLPDGPADEALNMLNDIMNFYNKDMFNQ